MHNIQRGITATSYSMHNIQRGITATSYSMHNIQRGITTTATDPIKEVCVVQVLDSLCHALLVGLVGLQLQRSYVVHLRQVEVVGPLWSGVEGG